MRRHRLYIATQLHLMRRLVLAILCLTISIVSTLFIYDLLTPYSVSVAGYTRSDGSTVESYSRRPPGSVVHDSPFVWIRNILVLLDILFAVRIIRTFWIIRRHDHVALFIQSINWKYEFPIKPDIELKYTASTVRQLCSACTTPIDPGNAYYYFKHDPASIYCESCYKKMDTAETQRKAMDRWANAYNRILELRLQQLQEEYRRKFHHRLDNPERYSM